MYTYRTVCVRHPRTHATAGQGGGRRRRPPRARRWPRHGRGGARPSRGGREPSRGCWCVARRCSVGPSRWVTARHARVVATPRPELRRELPRELRAGRRWRAPGPRARGPSPRGCAGPSRRHRVDDTADGRARRERGTRGRHGIGRRRSTGAAPRARAGSRRGARRSTRHRRCAPAPASGAARGAVAAHGSGPRAPARAGAPPPDPRGTRRGSARVLGGRRGRRRCWCCWRRSRSGCALGVAGARTERTPNALRALSVNTPNAATLPMTCARTRARVGGVRKRLAPTGHPMTCARTRDDGWCSRAPPRWGTSGHGEAQCGAVEVSRARGSLRTPAGPPRAAKRPSRQQETPPRGTP